MAIDAYWSDDDDDNDDDDDDDNDVPGKSRSLWILKITQGINATENFGFH